MSAALAERTGNAVNPPLSVAGQDPRHPWRDSWRYAAWRRACIHERRSPAIVVGIPLLYLGFVGGTIYHACRCNSLWLQLDYIPIALLAIWGTVWLWRHLFCRYRREFLHGALLMILLVGMLFVVPLPESRQIRISMGYGVLAIMLILPAAIISYLERFKSVWRLLAALGLFVIAVGFRIFDFEPSVKLLFPMGTHFLWHLFGAAAAQSMMMFLSAIEERAA